MRIPKTLMRLKKTNNILLSLLFLIFVSCASSPRFTSKHKNHITGTTNNSGVNSTEIYKDNGIIYSDTAVLETQTGIASYYADKFNGKITYSGKVYNMYGISAAHQTYPMGTVLRITNLKNGKTVILKVNDRMPYNPDRIIDLSLGAAQKLDMVHDGLAKVKVEVLKFGKGKK